MAKDKSDAGAAPQLYRDLMEQLLLGTGRVRRFTQDSPVLPDVWLEYAKGPDDPTRRTGGGAGEDPYPAVKLLLTPYREVLTGEVREGPVGAAGRAAQAPRMAALRPRPRSRRASSTTCPRSPPPSTSRT